MTGDPAGQRDRQRIGPHIIQPPIFDDPLPMPDVPPRFMTAKHRALSEYRSYKAAGRLDEWRRRWQFVLGFKFD